MGIFRSTSKAAVLASNNDCLSYTFRQIALATPPAPESVLPRKFVADLQDVTLGCNSLQGK
jgi:hypothetical protein